MYNLLAPPINTPRQNCSLSELPELEYVFPRIAVVPGCTPSSSNQPDIRDPTTPTHHHPSSETDPKALSQTKQPLISYESDKPTPHIDSLGPSTCVPNNRQPNNITTRIDPTRTCNPVPTITFPEPETTLFVLARMNSAASPSKPCPSDGNDSYGRDVFVERVKDKFERIHVQPEDKRDSLPRMAQYQDQSEETLGIGN
ncbi:hypothetical protein Droror1_Dr00018116 [Drosera rotundifolia]